MSDDWISTSPGRWYVPSRQGAISVVENSIETLWDISGKYSDENGEIKIYNDTPEEIMQIDQNGKVQEFRLFNTWEYDLRYLAGVIGAEDEVGYGGYSARLVVGNDINYNGLDYTGDFTYFAVEQNTLWRDILLIGADHMALLKYDDYMADPVKRIVYVEVSELTYEGPISPPAE